MRYHSTMARRCAGTMLVLLGLVASLPARADEAPSTSAKAAPTQETFCVRPDSATYGRGDGSDWDNALTGIPDAKSDRWGEGTGKIGGGDLVLVAGGDYRKSLVAGADGTADTPLVIRRATAAAHGPDAGWKADLDAQARFVGPASVSLRGRAWVILDGVTDSGIFTSSDEPHGLDIAKSHDLVVQFVHVDGSANRDSFIGMTLVESQNVTVRHCRFANTPNDNLRLLRSTDCVIEHCHLGPRIAPAPGKYGWHADLIEARGNSGIDFRFNTIGWAADGVFLFEGNKDWRIYGNVFAGTEEARGGKATRTHSSNPPNGPVYVYNNVFYRIQAGISYGSGITGDARNNVFYQTGHDSFGSLTHDYNYYFDCGADIKEEHKVTGDNPFVDAAKQDFRPRPDGPLVDAGAALPAPGAPGYSPAYERDFAGNPRPAGKACDVGAFESQPPTTPSPAAN